MFIVLNLMSEQTTHIYSHFGAFFFMLKKLLLFNDVDSLFLFNYVLISSFKSVEGFDSSIFNVHIIRLFKIIISPIFTFIATYQKGF